MVHWIYVLECEDDFIYVGETTRLFRRFTEHLYKHGSVNTHIHKPVKLIGLYKLTDNYYFYKYRNEIRNGDYNRFIIDDWLDKNENCDNLLIENHITEIYMAFRAKDRPKINFRYNDCRPWRVRGGKYTRTYSYDTPEIIHQEDIIDRPTCDCELPCEVKISNDGDTIYYVCALKNVWNDMNLDIYIEEPCEFFQVYKDDIYIKKQYELIQESIYKNKWVSNLPLSTYKVNPEPCVICNKINYCPIYCYGKVRKVCQTCFSNKFDELKNKYDITSKCLFADDD